MTKEIIQVELRDVIKHGVLGYGEIIIGSYGEDNGVIEAAYHNMSALRELYCGEKNKITNFIRTMLKDGNTFVLLSHKLEQLENFSDSDTQFIIEIRDNGEHIGYIDGEEANW